MQISLTPGFSPVRSQGTPLSRFSGFPALVKPLKRFGNHATHLTGLKPGVNERSEPTRAAGRLSEIENRKSKIENPR